MNENSKFKLKYDELRQGDPTHHRDDKKDGPSDNDTQEHVAASAQTICFVWPNGRQKFFNYAYLVSGELTLDDQMTTVTLNFTSEVVILKGHNLQQLFKQLSHHTSSLIKQLDRRYASMAENEESVVVEISVTPLA